MLLLTVLRTLGFPFRGQVFVPSCADANPITIGSVSLTYDALGRMVEQSVGSANSQIVYGPLGGKLALMNSGSLTKAFVPLPGGATAVYTSSGLAYYRHSDHLGSSRLSSTPTQTVYSGTAYSPFGEPYASTGAIDPSFTGQNQDTTSGLYDFLFREQDPNQGRWNQPDPAGLAAVSPSNPQSWNRYAYLVNNPLAAVDRFGLFCVYLNDTGDGVESIDVNSNADECGASGGEWFPDSSDNGSTFNGDPNGGGSCATVGGQPVGCSDQNFGNSPPDVGSSFFGGLGFDPDLGGNSSGGGGLLERLYCYLVPSGEVTSVGGSLGVVGGLTGSVDYVVNYTNGNVTVFKNGGGFVGFNSEATGYVSYGTINGSLGPNNSNYAGRFYGGSISAGVPGVFGQVSKGGMFISGVSAGAGLPFGRFNFAVNSTNSSNLVSLGQNAPPTNPFLFALFHFLRKICKP